MSLQQALDDCLIDFDRRVLVTDLLEEFKLTYKDTHEVLEAHIKQQESGSATKYEKRFIVHGMQAGDNSDVELYTIVQGEDKLKEWLGKLRNSQSQLYSVEIAGGSKSAAPIFKPMQHVEVKLAKMEQRLGAAPKGVTNGSSNSVHKPSEISKPSSIKVEESKPSGNKVEATSPSDAQKKSSPSEQKGKGKATAAVAKKGNIGSFFSAAPAAKTQPAKETKVTPNKPAASSMDHFLKKQPAPSASQAKQTPTSKAKKASSPAKNTSVQLFNEESDASSDDEEKMDKLRRKVVGSGDELDEKDDKPSVSKRRRIVDSDDEEQPQKKAVEPQQQNKADKQNEETAMEVEAATDETFLDDDGFVITVKAKKPTQAAKKKASPTASASSSGVAAAAPTTKKKSPPAAGKSAKETPKSKQGSITNFFKKK